MNSQYNSDSIDIHSMKSDNSLKSNVQAKNRSKSSETLNFSENKNDLRVSTSLLDLRSTDDDDHNHQMQQNRQQQDKHNEWIQASDIGTSIESIDTEHHANHCHHNHDYYVDDEQIKFIKRCSSFNSTTSSGYYDSETIATNTTIANDDDGDDDNDDGRHFMEQFIDKIFTKCKTITLNEKSKFGHYSQMESGRKWFARIISQKRNHYKCILDESTFYSLAQYFAIILFECSESDDFQPAKILMNMCFTYYYYHNGDQNCDYYHRSSFKNQSLKHQFTKQKSTGNNNNSNKQYLFTILRDQPIWKLKRFWNAAFFDAIQCEREKFYEKNNRSNHYYDWQFHANLTFGQLGTFTYNIHALDLPKEFCQEFLHKQSTIANITTEQFKILEENIENMYQ